MTLCLFISLDSWRIMYACYEITLCIFFFSGYTNNSLFLLKGNDLLLGIGTPKPKVNVFQWKSKIRSKEFFIITYYPDEFQKNQFGERAEF